MNTRWCPVCGAKNVRKGGYVQYKCCECGVWSHFRNWLMSAPKFCKKCKRIEHPGFPCPRFEG